MLELPLSLKYACPAPTTWRLAVSCLLDVLKEGLVTARQHRQHSANVWPRLAACLEAFLFSQRYGRDLSDSAVVTGHSWGSAL